MADVPLREEGRYRGVQRRTRRKKIFSDGKRFLGRPGERWRAAETMACFPRALPSCPLANAPGFLRPPASRGAFGNRARSFLTKKIPIRSAGGGQSGMATWRVEGQRF